jgi:acetoin utilization deacetylase AcuC-like enzyme
MDIIYDPIFLDHDTGYHPENANRLKALGDLKKTHFENGEKYLDLVHQHDYIKTVKKASAHQQALDPDTPTSTGSYSCAVHAVGAAIEAARTDGFAVVRPPGHHAYPDHASGFCLFNNLAIAVQYLVNEGKRVFVLDFDGHCGDGTEHFFYSSDKVLMLSIHQYPAFPGKGYIDEIGIDRGKGFTLNAAIPPGGGDDVYFDCLDIFLPVAQQFKPDVVAVSAGFDAHHSDPLLNLRYSTNAFYETGRILREQFDHVFAVLEGGYNLNYLPKCFYSFLAGMNGQNKFFEEPATVSSDTCMAVYENRMTELKQILGPFWILDR